MRSTDVVDLIDIYCFSMRVRLSRWELKWISLFTDTSMAIYVESLKTIFLNLLDNSIDALESDRKRILKINCASDEREYSFTIHDNGVDTADSADYIFHPFYT